MLSHQELTIREGLSQKHFSASNLHLSVPFITLASPPDLFLLNSVVEEAGLWRLGSLDWGFPSVPCKLEDLRKELPV